MDTPVTIGVVGLGGYGGSIIRMLMEEYAHLPSQFKLVSVCSNDFDKHPEQVARLQAAGITLEADLDTFLKGPMQAVWLPLPIPLHRPFTEKALAAGKAVICEKPAAGSVDDVDAMIAARDRTGLPVAIGFQDVYDPTTLPLKRDLLAGRIGQVVSATVTACWPRNSAYYGRASWAGAFRIGQSWVMDSPIHNALSHYINLPLFLLGQDEASSATIESVEAELYRVNPIENHDTAALRLTLAGGVPLLVLFTHACEDSHNPVLRIHGSQGTVTRSIETIEITDASSTQRIDRHYPTLRYEMMTRLANLVQGRPDDERGLATLEVARAQVLAVNAAAEATTVHELDASDYRILSLPEGRTLRVIPGIETLLMTCAEKQQMPHESGLASWTRPAGFKGDLAGYTHFAGPRVEPASARS